MKGEIVMTFDPLWIPIIGTVIGTVAIPAIVAVVQDLRVEEKRLEVQHEVHRLDQEWEAARARSRRP